MTPLFFFGSDQYSQSVLNYLQDNSNLSITHLTNLSSFDRQSLGDGGPLTPNTIGLSASFPYLFPPKLIDSFQGKLYNLHPSLLPQYRNVAPVPYAIALGDKATGITLQQIDTQIDHGPILAQQPEPILSTDTTPILLHRLFTLGAQMFLDYLHNPVSPTLRVLGSLSLPSFLIFTHKLTTESGHLEWTVVQKLINHESVTLKETTNPLLQLRLKHHPQGEILHDLVRALAGYEKVWTTAPTQKGNLRLTIESVLPSLTIKLAGKPKAISYNDFVKYYLE